MPKNSRDVLADFWGNKKATMIYPFHILLETFKRDYAMKPENNIPREDVIKLEEYEQTLFQFSAHAIRPSINARENVQNDIDKLADFPAFLLKKPNDGEKSYFQLFYEFTKDEKDKEFIMDTLHMFKDTVGLDIDFNAPEMSRDIIVEEQEDIIQEKPEDIIVEDAHENGDEKEDKIEDIGDIFFEDNDNIIVENEINEEKKDVINEEKKDVNNEEKKDVINEEKKDVINEEKKDEIAGEEKVDLSGEMDKINNVCNQLEWVADNLFQRGSTFSEEFKKSAQAIRVISSPEYDKLDELKQAEAKRQLITLSDIIGKSDYVKFMVETFEAQENPPFGKDAKDLYDVVGLLEKKIGEEVDTVESRQLYHDLALPILFKKVSFKEPEGLGTGIFNPEFVAFGNPADLSDAELEEAEKAFDTIFKPFEGRDLFDLTSFTSSQEVGDEVGEALLVRSTETKRDIQIGKANILRAMLNANRTPEYVKYKNDEEKQRIFIRLPKLELTEKTKAAQREYKENYTKPVFDELKKVMDSEDISRYEVKLSGNPDGIKGDFPFGNLQPDDDEAIRDAADHFDKVFAPVKDKMKLGGSNAPINSFQYLGMPVVELVRSALQQAKKKPIHHTVVAISKAYVLFQLAKGEELVFAPKELNPESEGFFELNHEGVPAKLRVTQITIKEQEEKENAEREAQRKKEIEQKRLEEEQKILEEDAERQKQENEKFQKQLEDERRKEEEEKAKENELIKEGQRRINEANEIAVENAKARSAELSDDYKELKYTHRRLSGPENAAKTYLDRFKADDFFDLSSDEKKNDLANTLKNAGVADVSNPKVLSSLVVLYALGVKGKNLDDLEKLSPEEKKQLGNELLADFKARPVIGTLPGSAQKAQENLGWYGEMVGKANDIWFHKSDIKYPPKENLYSAEGLNQTLENEKIGLAYGLADTLPKLTANWTNRSGKVTDENPYGIDAGYSFGSKYAGKKNPFDNLDQQQRDMNGISQLATTMNWFRAYHHDDPSNKYQNRLKAVQKNIMDYRYSNLSDYNDGIIDRSTMEGDSYDVQYIVKGLFEGEYPDHIMKILDNTTENEPDEQVIQQASINVGGEEHFLGGIEMKKEMDEKIRQINETSHPELKNLPFNSDNNNEEPDYNELMKEENEQKLIEYEKVFDRIFDPMRFLQKKMASTRINTYGSKLYNEFAINFSVNGKSVKDISREKTEIPDDDPEFSNIKKRNRIAKVIVLHALAHEGKKVEYAPFIPSVGHAFIEGEPVEIKVGLSEVKAQMEQGNFEEQANHPNLLDQINNPNQSDQINIKVGGDGEDINRENGDDLLNTDKKTGEDMHDISEDEFDQNVIYDRKVPNLENYENAGVYYGGLLQFREELNKDLEQYERMLRENEEHFVNNGVTDPKPEDYIAVKVALTDLKDTLDTDDTDLDTVRTKINRFYNCTQSYSSNHREFFRSHRSAESADRHLIISGMADLTKVHLKIFDKMKGELGENISKFHSDGEDFKIGNESFSSLDDILKGNNPNISADNDINSIRYYTSIKIEEGKNALPLRKEEAEEKMLYDRYARKTGITTKEKRVELKPLRGRHNTEDFARNYLAIKYRDAIDDAEGIEDKIRVNERIREKPFKKEVVALENDFYFGRVISTSKNWVESWKTVEAKSDALLEEYKEKARKVGTEGITEAKQKILDIRQNKDLNEQPKNWKEECAEYVPIAEQMFYRLFMKPQYKPLLHAFASEGDKLKTAAVLDVAEYIKNVKGLSEDNNRMQREVEGIINDSSFYSSIAHRLSNWYEEVLFPAQDKQRKAIKENGKNIINEKAEENKEAGMEEKNNKKTEGPGMVPGKF